MAGVAYPGAPYNDGNAAQPGDSVAPGGSHTYIWHVPESAGPAATDPSSIVWMYHSHVSEVNNTNAGLVGIAFIAPMVQFFYYTGGD